MYDADTNSTTEEIIIDLDGPLLLDSQNAWDKLMTRNESAEKKRDTMIRNLLTFLEKKRKMTTGSESDQQHI
jgi:hypothetical protein